MTDATVPVPRAALPPGLRLWRRWLRLRFRLFQRHRHNRLVVERVAGMPLIVLPDVFNPKLFWTGEFLARLVATAHAPPAAAQVLDLGTGSGVGAIFAARRAERVVAVDVNPAAVRCARVNVVLHGLEERVEVREGDLFGPVGAERFDLVLFNPPYYPGSPHGDLDRAFRAGDVPGRFARALASHLSPGGSALVVLSTSGDPSFVAELREAGHSVTVAAEERRIGETLTAYRVRPC